MSTSPVGSLHISYPISLPCHSLHISYPISLPCHFCPTPHPPSLNPMDGPLSVFCAMPCEGRGLREWWHPPLGSGVIPFRHTHTRERLRQRWWHPSRGIHPEASLPCSWRTAASRRMASLPGSACRHRAACLASTGVRDRGRAKEWGWLRNGVG